MLIGDAPGTLIIALPENVLAHPKFEESLPTWLGNLDEEGVPSRIDAGRRFPDPVLCANGAVGLR